MNTHATSTAGVNGRPERKSGPPLASGYQQLSKEPSFPHSPEIELGVLGCILLDAPFCFGILEAHGIAPRHFYDLRYQALFRLLLKMRKAGEPIDSQTFFLRAQEKGLAKTPEQMNLILTLTDQIPSARHLEWFLPQLIEAHNRRLTLDVSRRLEKVALDASAPVGTLLADAQEAISGLARHTEREPFTVRSMAELCEQPLPENDNILGDRLLAQGQSLTVLGAGGIGKSRLLLQLAACTIAGRPFFGLPTHAPGTRWLILQAENSNRRLQMDAGGLRTWLGADWPRVAERLFIHTLENNGDSFVSLDSPETCQRIASLIEKLAPDVVCFDPLNCFGHGDLNNDSDMRRTCQAITRICQQGDPNGQKRAIVVLHHALTGRMGAARATGFDRSSFGRNSKLLHAWTRGSINIAPQGPNDNNRLVVSCGKCSNGEEFAPFGIRLNRATMTYESDADFSLHDWEAGVQEGRKREALDELLDLCQAEPCSRPAAVKKLIERGFSRATAYRSLKEAESEKLLIVNASGLLEVLEVESPSEPGEPSTPG